jgi:hypothetical protein
LIFATDLAISGNLNINSGAGSDTLQLGGNLAAVPGIGGAQGLFVGGATNLDTGLGQDLVAIEGSALFRGVVRIHLGGGLDDISITGDVDFDSNLKIDGGFGPNQLLLDEASVDINLPGELKLNSIIEVDAEDLAEAVAELNAEIELRAEACLLHHQEEGGGEAN